MSSSITVAKTSTPAGESLSALHEGFMLGTLRLHRPHPGLCLATGMELPETEFSREAGQALLAEFLRLGHGIQLEALCWDRPQDLAFIQCLLRAGFHLKEEKLYVERLLGQNSSLLSADDPFTYEPLERLGPEAFIQVLSELEEAPAGQCALEHARVGFAELEAMAGDALDGQAWQLAILEGQAAGLLLPQPFPHKPEEGTLFYMGLRPGFRGRGLGHFIHLRGLARLAAMGVTRYLGSTPATNRSMCRIFQRNGCQEMGLRRSYSAPAV